MTPSQITALFNRDRFASSNGMTLAEVRLGYARAEMTVLPSHINAVGIVQGGAVFTLADLAFAGACNSHGALAVACQSDITYFKPVHSGRLTAVAEEIARTRSLSTCLVTVTDDLNNTIALFKGVAFIKATPLQP